MPDKAISSRSRAVSTLVPLALLLCFAIVLAVACARRDRATEFSAVAGELGMEFREDLPADVVATIRGLPGVAYRDRSFFPRVLVDDRSMIFDWVWRDGQIKDRDRVAQTVFAIHYEGAGFPPVLLAERTTVSEAELRSSGGEVLLTSPVAWIERYLLAGRAKAPIREIFPPEVREVWTLPRGVRIEANGDWVVVYRPGRVSNPSTFEWERGDVESLLEPWRPAP